MSANTSWYLYNFRRSTIQTLFDEGWKVICLAPRDEYSERLFGLGAVWFDLPMDNRGGNPIRELRLFLRFIHYYRKHRPVAAFHFTIKNNIYGTWAARLFGIPSVMNISGLGTAFIRSGWLAWVARTLYKSTLSLAHHVFCQNAEDYEMLDRLDLVSSTRLSLLPGSGVDIDRFHPSLLVDRDHSEPFCFLYSGRILKDKGLIELIEAVAGINEENIRCKLHLYGFLDADNVSAISSDIVEEWSSLPGIHWEGTSDSMELAYSHCDCVVLPSYREGMPRSLLEAGAMGLPVVATDVPGCRHVIENGVNGLLCEPRSADSLRAALEKMLCLSGESRKEMGRMGRARVEAHFDERRVVSVFIDTLFDIVASRRTA